MTRIEMQRFLELPAEERLELADFLWNSVQPESEARFLSIPAWQRAILDERLADLTQNPADEQDWEDVKRELWPEV